MQKVTVTLKTLDIDKTAQTRKAVYNTVTEDYIVASTKTRNILVRKLQENGAIVSNVKADKVFIEREDVAKMVTDYCCNVLYPDDEFMANAVSAHMISALDKACLYRGQDE